MGPFRQAAAREQDRGHGRPDGASSQPHVPRFQARGAIHPTNEGLCRGLSQVRRAVRTVRGRRRQSPTCDRRSRTCEGCHRRPLLHRSGSKQRPHRRFLGFVE